MHTLPRGHIPRPRLVEELAAASVGLVEASGGYGKSVLAAELADYLGIPALEADVLGPIADAPLLVAALRRGALRAGLSHLASALEGGGDAAAVADAMIAVPHALLLVVDEAQELSGSAVEALAALVRRPPGEVRLLVLGRKLPARVIAAAPTDAVILDAGRLAFSRAEVVALLEAALGEEPGAAEEAAVVDAAQGWPALAALAAARLAREPAATRAHLAGTRRTLAPLVDDALAGLDPAARASVAQLAHLPLLSPEIVDEVAGDGAFDRLLRAGMPIAPRRDGWYELPGRLREELAARRALEPPVARSAAAAYAERGELATAVQLLARAHDHAATAELLAQRPLAELDEVGLPVLQATLAMLPDDVLAAQPRALLQAARVAELGRAREARAKLIERTGALLDGDLAIARELQAERAVDCFRRYDYEQADALADAVIAAAAPGEALARARALVARALSATSRDIVGAEELFEEAAALFGAIGEQRWRGDALAALAYYERFRRGHVAAAAETMAAALACLAGPTRDRATWLTFRAEIATYAGDAAEAEAALREAEAIGRALGDLRVASFAAWSGAAAAGLRGDLAVVRQRLALAERDGTRWMEGGNGALFLSDAAMLFTRLGEPEEAAAYLERAEALASELDLPIVPLLARGVYEARHGDPLRAEQALAVYQDHPERQMAPRDEWRVLLERAGAAKRAGDAERASALAARGFEAARALGLTELVSVHEPGLAAALAPLAAAAGSRGARDAGAHEPALAVAALGRFAVTADGRAADPPPGHPATLVKLLAVARAPVPLEGAAEALWPGVSAEVGRRRLRNVLNRIRAACGELVVRDGDALALGERVEVDLQLFAREATAALAALGSDREALARAALARYGGELLPADRYAPWADGPREELRRRVLDLLDLLAHEARERGALDEAIRLLDQAISVEPADEARYAACAELLLAQGRRGSARDLVDRARGLRRELGLPPSARLERLAASTRPAVVRSA